MGLLKLSFLNLFRFKARTLLAIIAVMIGIAAIIVLVSAVDGLQLEAEKIFSRVKGAIVLEKGALSGAFSLLDEDYEEKLENIAGVKKALPVVIGLAQGIEGKSLAELGIVRIVGEDWSITTKDDSFGLQGDIIAGRLPKPNEKGVVVIGTTLQDILNKGLGEKIKIAGEKFKIIGIYKAGSALTGKYILMNIDDAREVLAMPKNKVNMFNIVLRDVLLENEVIQRIKFKYGDELKAISASDVSARLGDVLGNLRLMVFIVAAISALVAGIGIMNVMLMSVLERFREIGVLKAVGWSNRLIQKMVLLEGIWIGLIGAVLGIILGWSVSFYLNYFGIKTFVSLALVAQAALFSIIVAIIATYYPSHQAANLDPIEALRME